MTIPLISFSSSFEALKLQQEEEKILQIRAIVPSLRGLMKLDVVRSTAINKILAIMNVYNSRLDPATQAAIASEIYEMSLRYENLDVDLICATITHETALTWRPDITSPAGAIGLMQLMPYTARALSEEEGIAWTSTKEILHNPILNLRMGCRYLSYLITSYQLDGGLAAYNGGENRAAKWLASGRDDGVLYEETRGYVPAVLRLYDTFKGRSLNLTM